MSDDACSDEETHQVTDTSSSSSSSSSISVLSAETAQEYHDNENKKAVLQDKFRKLRERRAKLVIESKAQSLVETTCAEIRSTSESPSCSSNNNNDSSSLLGRKRREKCTSAECNSDTMISDINSYMPYTFTVSSQINDAKKNKLEKDLEDALKKKDFAQCEEISDHIEKDRFTKQVQGAITARSYMKDIIKKKEGKRMHKKKLKWTFNKKERWEMKGNMGK